MTIPKHYQQGFNACDDKDQQERVNTATMQEIAESGEYVGTLSGGFLQDYQSKQDGTPGTLCQLTFVTDDNRAFSRFSVGYLKNGSFLKMGMRLVRLAQDPFGQKTEYFPRYTEGEKDGRAWCKLEDADGLRVRIVLFINGTYTSNDGSVHPKAECLGIFDANGHTPTENQTGRAETAALNSCKHWLKTKMEEAVSIPQQVSMPQQGGYQQAAPAQWQQQAPAQGYQQPQQQQWQAKVSQPRQPSPTQSLDMAVAANERAMARAQQQRQQVSIPQQQSQWAGFNAPPPQPASMPDPRQFAIPNPPGQASGGKQQNFQDDALPF